MNALVHEGRGVLPRQSRPHSLLERMRCDVQNYLELAVDYGNGGFNREALELLENVAHLSPDEDQVYPMVYYLYAFYAEGLGDADSASRARQLARTMPADYCFPHRWEAAPPCARPSTANPTTHGALLPGSLRSSTRACHQRVGDRARPRPAPLTHRNLASPTPPCGPTCYQYRHSTGCRPDPTDARCSRTGRSPRLPALIPLRASPARTTSAGRRLTGRCHTRMIILLTRQGDNDRASNCPTRQFHNWEGGGEIREGVDALLTRRARFTTAEPSPPCVISPPRLPRNSLGRPRRWSSGPDSVPDRRRSYRTGTAHRGAFGTQPPLRRSRATPAITAPAPSCNSTARTKPTHFRIAGDLRRQLLIASLPPITSPNRRTRIRTGP
jgi:hypothetical protein